MQFIMVRRLLGCPFRAAAVLIIFIDTNEAARVSCFVTYYEGVNSKALLFGFIQEAFSLSQPLLCNLRGTTLIRVCFSNEG